MNIIFLEPGFPSNQREFVRALHSIGANVIGVGDRPFDWLDDETKSRLGGYQQIENVTDEGALEWAVRDIQKKMWVDRLETTIESHILPAAHVRERCTIPGVSSRTAYLCRDKVAMKEVLRRAGVPTAASGGVESLADARSFVAEHGFPVILKPRDSAGASGTYRAGTDAELESVAIECGLADGAPAAIEEFVEGHEGFYDTLTVNGEIRHDFVSHYYPNVLEAMRTRWISPQIVATNRMDSSEYQQLRDMAQRVNRALDMSTAATHMEWFFGPKGLKFSEIGCRPPGVGQWDSYCAGNEFDLYREWALAVCHGTTDQHPSRRYSCGIIALRPDRDGFIQHYKGVDGIFAKYGANIVGQHFPTPGAPTQGIAAGYMANAWLRVRHEDYDALRSILNEIGETVQVCAA
jgi:formate-dependent phosphoribosylglycinamide formyltransferase (GAR transformylase)